MYNFIKKAKNKLITYYLYSVCIINNHFRKKKIINDNSSVVISLTSYGMRLNKVYLTIESLARATKLPKKIYLWIDDEEFLSNLPMSLRRLVDRGLTIRKTNDYGPHKKYYPYINEKNEFDEGLVTVDDDILYPKYFLSVLINKLKSDEIVCYRARRITFDNGIMDSYNNWGFCNSTDKSILNFATGVSGILYPPGFLFSLKKKGDEFLDVCPKADDIWLHHCAISSGFLIRQVNKDAIHFFTIPRSQVISLSIDNCSNGGNDEQIIKTYSDDELKYLKDEFYSL